jgi:hypothetical protein
MIDASGRFAGVNRIEGIKMAKRTRSAFDFDSLGPGSTAYSGTKAYCLALSP